MGFEFLSAVRTGKITTLVWMWFQIDKKRALEWSLSKSHCATMALGTAPFFQKKF